MRATMISMLVVAALAVGICLYSLGEIGQATEEMDAMRTEVMEMVEKDELQRAHERLGRMEEIWRGHEEMLAVLAPHEALHEITRLIIEGKANLEADDLDDFNRSMALLGESLEHLHLEEQVRLFNIL